MGWGWAGLDSLQVLDGVSYRIQAHHSTLTDKQTDTRQTDIHIIQTNR